MAAPNDLETSVPIGNEGDSTPDTVAVATDALKLFGMTDLTAGLVAPPSGIAYDRCKAGTNNHAYGLGVDSGLPGSILLYTHAMGMEVDEWVSWFFKGYPGLGAALDAAAVAGGPYTGIDTGEALTDKLLTDADPTNPYFLPVLTRHAEGAGWFKEAVTLKKFEDGKWADGTQINLRQFGEGGPAVDKAFPNVLTPPPTTGISFLQDVKDGVFNGGEYNEPFGDAAQINGLFPNWPSGAAGIIDAGLSHYYMSGWHTPSRCRNFWINRTIWTGLTADQKNMYRYAARASCLENMAISASGQDAIVANFQALGAVIHRHLPRDVVLRLRDAITEVQDENAAGDGTGAYHALVLHQREFARNNHVRHGSATEDRRMRYQRTEYRPAQFTPDA
jgi:hypothetical protein